jgi:hypothetical protein
METSSPGARGPSKLAELTTPPRVIVGVAPALMVKTAADDVAPSGPTTVTFTVPAALKRDAGTEAVSCVALTNVVVRAVEPK